MSAPGIEGGKKFCQRAIPAISRTVGRRRGNQLPRLLVVAANQRDGPMRASFAEDPVGLVLIRSDMPFTHASSVDPTPCSFQHRQQAHEPNQP
jgi:hypothetical protein